MHVSPSPALLIAVGMDEPRQAPGGSSSKADDDGGSHLSVCRSGTRFELLGRLFALKEWLNHRMVNFDGKVEISDGSANNKNGREL